MQLQKQLSSHLRVAEPCAGGRIASLAHSRCCAPRLFHSRPLRQGVRKVPGSSSKRSSADIKEEDIQYVDTWSDVQFINMCRRAYGGLAGWQSARNWKEGHETYQGMIEVSRALMKVTSTVVTGMPTCLA